MGCTAFLRLALLVALMKDAEALNPSRVLDMARAALGPSNPIKDILILDMVLARDPALGVHPEMTLAPLREA